MSAFCFGVLALVGALLAARQLRHLAAADDVFDVFDDDLVLGGRLTYVLHDEAERLVAEADNRDVFEEEKPC